MGQWGGLNNEMKYTLGPTWNGHHNEVVLFNEVVKHILDLNK